MLRKLLADFSGTFWLVLAAKFPLVGIGFLGSSFWFKLANHVLRIRSNLVVI